MEDAIDNPVACIRFVQRSAFRLFSYLFCDLMRFQRWPRCISLSVVWCDLARILCATRSLRLIVQWQIDVYTALPRKRSLEPNAHLRSRTGFHSDLAAAPALSKKPWKSWRGRFRQVAPAPPALTDLYCYWLALALRR